MESLLFDLFTDPLETFCISPTACLFKFQLSFFFTQIGQVSDPERLKCLIDKMKQHQANRSCDKHLHKKVEAKVRPLNLKYAVGMIVEHHYRHRERLSTVLGVICDWDPNRFTPDG